MAQKKNKKIFIIGLLVSSPTLLFLFFASSWLKLGIAQEPNKTRIAFSSSRDGNFEIYLMDVDGKNMRNLTNHSANDGWPDWSPDGKKIAFVSDRDGWGIYVMDANGKNLKQLGFGNSFSPVWSPDGKKIAFERRTNGYSSIYVMNADGSNPIDITRARVEIKESDERPSWSPDGRKIAFQSNRASPPERRWMRQIFVIDVETRQITQITNRGYATRPSWSPDGQKIAYQLDNEGNAEIFIMDSDGKNPINLTKSLGADRNPSWSPDGTKILFDRLRDLNHRNVEIYIMDSDGNNQIRLTHSRDAIGNIGPARMFDPSVLSVDLSHKHTTTWGQIKSKF